MSVVIEDASGMRGEADRLFTPPSAEEAASILREASRLDMPVTVSGAGTGVAGGRVPSGGWALSLEKFTRLEVRSGAATVGAGVLLKDLQAAASATGQFYPPDPTEWSSSIGGNIATNASGSRSFRYGATRRWLRALTVAMIDGSILEVHRGDKVPFPYTPIPSPRTTKNTAGYFLPPDVDWIDLFCGSDGTLGAVLQAEVTLLPQPHETLAGVVFFTDDAGALAAAGVWRAVPQLNMLEYMDEPSLDFLRTRYCGGIPVAARACLMIEQELDGLEGDAVDEWLGRLEQAGGLEESWFGESAADRERFRAFRHALPELVNDHVRRNGFEKLSSDLAVPLDRYGEMHEYYRRTLARDFPERHTIYGHVGDAHVHVNVLSQSPADFERGKQWMTEAAAQAVALGGTVSAEHGLGKRKVHLLPLMYSEAQRDIMRGVKRRLDPGWLLGRGTLLPPC